MREERQQKPGVTTRQGWAVSVSRPPWHDLNWSGTFLAHRGFSE
jgi:hypothetical protein